MRIVTFVAVAVAVAAIGARAHTRHASEPRTSVEVTVTSVRPVLPAVETSDPASAPAASSAPTSKPVVAKADPASAPPES